MFADPVKILKDFGIGDSMIIVDLGAGSGFYSLPAARTAHNGKVYAVEVQRDFVVTLKDKAKLEGLKNVECLWGNIEKRGGTQIAENIADVVIISNVLFLANNKKHLLEEAYRILKSGGRVLFIDWSDTTTPFGPKGERLIKPDLARKMFEAEKFSFDRGIEAGEHHYGMIFRKI
jgi:ubiquinone/menaquinone biosynthesis C-methylase UbiE